MSASSPSSVGRLELSTPGEHEILLRRDFAVSRERLWEAYTQADIVRRWLLGPPGWSCVVCDMDVRVGGRYRWVWRSDRDGHEMASGGDYREVAAPERLVYTETFD